MNYSKNRKEKKKAKLSKTFSKLPHNFCVHWLGICMHAALMVSLISIFETLPVHVHGMQIFSWGAQKIGGIKQTSRHHLFLVYLWYLHCQGSCTKKELINLQLLLTPTQTCHLFRRFGPSCPFFRNFIFSPILFSPKLSYFPASNSKNGSFPR